MNYDDMLKRETERTIGSLIYSGRYGDAMAAIREGFCGKDQTAGRESFNFDLDTWLYDVVGGVRAPEGRSAFMRELLTLSDQDPSAAFWRVANTHGVQADVFPELLDILRADLNREVSLYVTPGLNLAARDGTDVMVGPLWLVLLLCVCRPTRSSSLGVLAHKKSFSDADLDWIDQAAALAANHGADLRLSKTVTWKGNNPALRDVVSNIEARVSARR